MPTMYVIQYIFGGTWQDAPGEPYTDRDEARAALAQLRESVGSALGKLRLISRTEEVLD